MKDLTKKENWTPELRYVNTTRIIIGFVLGVLFILALNSIPRMETCLKTSTQMLEISGVKKDFLICETKPIRIIKEYETPTN